MKKLITLFLAFAGFVATVSADNYLPGTWNDHQRNDYSKFIYSGNVGTLTLSLAAQTTYEFGVDYGGSWKANYGTMCFNNCTGWVFTETSGNCKIVTTIAGNYTFTITDSNGSPCISVTYPGTNDDVVYFCNTVNWDQPYAYILHSSYWNNEKGTGSRYHPNGIAMTNISGTNIWKAEFPSGARRGYIAFTKAAQDGYEFFSDTEAAYRYDFSTGAYLYVPSNTVSDTKNYYDDKFTNYYNNGEWLSYPTYTRDVTAGKFGTICLPFDATVEGATVFKIVSTVGSGTSMTGINLESVNELEAGKAYIYKATSSVLTATFSGNYTSTPTEANGMLGNLSSSDITVPANNYVVYNNKVCPVGETVTVGQYKAYITLDGITAGARTANFIGFEDATGIENIQAENGQNIVYNLQGQRVTDAQKGLVIVDGKKMLRK